MADTEMMLDAYEENFYKYIRLEDYLLNVCCADVTEGYELRNITSRRMLLSNADNMLLLFDVPWQFPNHGGSPTQPCERILPYFEEIRLKDGKRKAEIKLQESEGKLSFSLLDEFNLYLRSVEQHIEAERKKLMLAKIYKALCLTTAVRDLEESLPEIALEMIFLLLHTTFQFKPGEKITPPEKPSTRLRLKFLEGSAARRFEEFVDLINESYNQWQSFNMDPVFLRFRELPDLFFHLVKAFQTLASYYQKMILNEYCRTTAVILVLMKFLKSENSINPNSEATKKSVKKIIMILRESFRYIQGPSLMPIMDKKYLSKVRKDFVSKMQKMFQAAHDDLYDPKSKMITNAAIFRGLQRCSFEKNANVKFPCPFTELINCYTQYPKALEEYMVEGRYRFDIKLTYNNIFFSKEDCLLNLPLMSEEAMDVFVTSSIPRMCDLPDKIENCIIRNFNLNNRYYEETTERILKQRDAMLNDGPRQERSLSKSNSSADNSSTEKEIEMKMENHGSSKELPNEAFFIGNHAISSDENSKISAEIPGDESRTRSEKERDLPNRRKDCIIRNLIPNIQEKTIKIKIPRQRDLTEEKIEIERKIHGNLEKLSNDASVADNHTNPFDKNSKNSAEIAGDESNSLTIDTGRKYSRKLSGIPIDIENNYQFPSELPISIGHSINFHDNDSCSSEDDSFVILPDVCDIDFS